MLTKQLSIAISNLVIRKIAELAPQVFIGVVETIESIDANLHSVRSGADLFRYVPKATATTMVVGDQVFMIKGRGTPMMIIGKVSGNVVLASELG